MHSMRFICPWFSTRSFRCQMSFWDVFFSLSPSLFWLLYCFWGCGVGLVFCTHSDVFYFYSYFFFISWQHSNFQMYTLQMDSQRKLLFICRFSHLSLFHLGLVLYLCVCVCIFYISSPNKNECWAEQLYEIKKKCEANEAKKNAQIFIKNFLREMIKSIKISLGLFFWLLRCLPCVWIYNIHIYVCACAATSV